MVKISIEESVLRKIFMDKRLPLVSTYSARQRDGTLPPQAEQILNPGGRPPEDGSQSGQKNRDFLKNPGGGGSLDPTGHRVIPKDRDEDHWDDF